MTVSAAVEGKIGRLTFSSPKANSLDSGTLRDFARLATELGNNPACSVIIIESPGKTFCAGASLDEMRALKSVQDATEFFALFGRAAVALRAVPQPVIARVQGKAVGGGVGIIAAADYALGTPEVAVKLSEFQIGVGPFVISTVLQWKIGQAETLALALSPEFKDAAWCVRTGLCSELVAGEAELDQRLASLSTQIAGFPSTGAVARFKALSSPAELSNLVEERAILSAESLFSDPR